MNSNQRRSGRAARVAILVAKGLAFTVTAGLIMGWATIIILGNFVWDTDDPKDPAPSPNPTTEETAIVWQLTSRQCQDGWPSHSIGKRGACSWHGGVESTYTTTDGQLTTRCGPRFQARTLERARELSLADGTIDCDWQAPTS